MPPVSRDGIFQHFSMSLEWDLTSSPAKMTIGRELLLLYEVKSTTDGRPFPRAMADIVQSEFTVRYKT